MASPKLIANRYEEVRLLGQGNLSRVHLVRDTVTGGLCALKRMQSLDPETADLMRNEYGALARIHHENVVRVHAFGRLPAGESYFTMDYVEGTPIDQAVHPGDVETALSCSLQILRGLEALHAGGLVHCDLKPDNVLVSRGDDGRVTARILDLGFVGKLTDEAGKKIRGTAGYVAPELLAGGVAYSRETDLYAFGATMYRVLTGRAAFPGRDPAAIVTAQRRSLPGTLALRAAGVPSQMDGPLLGLMSENPALRVSAERSWTEIAEQRASRVSQPAAIPAVTERVHAGPLLEREELIARARRLLMEMDQPAAMVLIGPSGAGKTRLAREIAIEAELSGQTVIWCDPGHPLVRQKPPQFTGRTLVVLDDVDIWPDSLLADAHLGALGDGRVTVVATQHRAPESGDPLLRLLLTLATPPSPTVERLQALGPDGVEALLSAALGRSAPRGLADRLTQTVGAYPGALLAELGRWIANGSLRRESKFWTIDEQRVEECAKSAPESWAKEFWQTLDSQAQLAAVARAGWPFAIEQEDLALAIGVHPSELEAGFAELAWRGILEDPQGAGRLMPPSIETYALHSAHGPEIDRVRDRLGAALRSAAEHAPRMRAAELRVADGIQSMALGRGDAAREAWSTAFDTALAFPSNPALAMRAGELLVTQTSAGDSQTSLTLSRLARLESDQDQGLRAEDLWRRALSMLPMNAVDTRNEWTVERAENLQAVGQYAAALALMDEVLGPEAALSDQGMRGRALSLRGWCLHRLNRWPEADVDFAAAEEALPADATRDRAALLSRVGFARSRRGDHEAAGALLGRALALAIESGDRRIEARVRGNLGIVAHSMGDPVRGARETLSAMKLMSGAGSLRGQMVGASNLVSNALSRSDWATWDESFQLLDVAARTSGSPLAYARSCDLLIQRCIRRGEIRDAERAYERGVTWLSAFTNREYEDRYRIHGALLSSMRSEPRGTRQELQAILRRAEAENFPLTAATAGCALGEIELAEHLTRDATATAKLVWKLGSAEPIDGIQAILLIARAAARESDLAVLEDLARMATPALERFEQVEVRDARAARNEIDAYIAHLRGNDAEAQARWDEGIQLLRGCGLALRLCGAEWTFGLAFLRSLRPVEAARHLRTAFDLASASGMDRWAALIAADCLAAYEAKPEHSVPSPDHSRVEVDLLPSIIRLVNSVLDFPELLERALSLASEQVRADRGFILLTGDSGEELEEMARFGSVSDEARFNAIQVSRTIVRWVARTNEVFQTSVAGSDPRLGSTQSVLDLSIRSVVCVPMRQRGNVIGTIYLESRSADSGFSEADVQLVEAFADLIAVAIERSRLHETMRRSRDRILDENLSLRRDVSRRFSAPNILGQSVEMERVLGEVARVASTGSSVLITGETGTGKDLIAKTIHYSSPRASRPLLTLNCSALPESLLEAELFGIERGVATGVTARPGIFERADGGTLFLDEIGDMPLHLQAKLLRVLQDQEITRVGGGRVQKVDVRIIAATWRDLAEMIAKGQFRDDLYYRIQQWTIHIPPLRERRVDIPILVEHFLREFCEKNGRAVPRVSESFLKVAIDEPWPGNVRQLENYVHQNAIMCDGLLLEPLVGKVGVARPAGRDEAGRPTWMKPEAEIARKGDLDSALQVVEKRWIEHALSEAQGNQRRAAELLGMRESTLRYRMRLLGIGEILAPTRPRARDEVRRK